MHDLVDIHRTNIAKAGVTLAKAIAEATTAYSASVAASEAALQVAMTRRIEAFFGAESAPPEPAVSETLARGAPAYNGLVVYPRDTIEGQTEAGG